MSPELLRRADYKQLLTFRKTVKYMYSILAVNVA